jgi:phosphatidylglycerophosphatase A
MFFVGVWSAANYSKKIGQNDPAEIVIDEVVGQLLTIVGIFTLLPFLEKKYIIEIINLGIGEQYLSVLTFFTAFILFRAFDIFKPWPIRYFDQKCDGGFGIMIDDVVAAILAIFAYFLLIYVVVDLSIFFKIL